MNVNSTSTYTYGSSASKGMSGLASGLDTESLVKEMLSGTQSKIDKQEGLKQQTEWKQEIYRDLITSINSLQSGFFSNTSPTSLTSSALYNTMSASTASKSFKVTASTSAPVGNTSISVHQLASNYSIASAARVSGKLSGTVNAEQLQSLIDAQSKDPRVLALEVGAASGTGDGTVVKIDLKRFFVDDSGAFRKNIDEDAIAAEIQKQLSEQAKLETKVSMAGGQLSIVSKDGERSLGVSDSSSALALSSLGLTTASEAKPNRSGTQRTLTGKTSLTPALHFNTTLDDSLQKDIALDVRDLVGADGKVSMDNVRAAMQSAFNKQFGSGVVNVKGDGDGIELATAISGRKITVNSGADKTVLAALGLKNGQSNRIAAYNTLKEMQVSTPLQGRRFRFEINGAKFSFSEDDDIDYVMSTINSSEAGVTVTYKPLEDAFIMTANDAGAGREIELRQTEGNLLNVMFGNAGKGLASGDTAAGAPLTAAQLKPSGTMYMDDVRSGLFTLTVNGKEHNIDLAKKTDAEKYTKEELIEKLNGELKKLFGTTEEYDGDASAWKEVQNIELLEDGTLAVRNGAAVELAGVKAADETELKKLAEDGNLAVALGLVKDSKGQTNVVEGSTTLADAGLAELASKLGIDASTTLAGLEEATKAQNGSVIVAFEDGRLVVSANGDNAVENLTLGNKEQMNAWFGVDALNLNIASGQDALVTQGRNAIVSIDGMMTERNSNVFNYNGMTVELTGVSKAAEGGEKMTGILMVDDGKGGLTQWKSVNNRWVDAQGYERAEDGKYVAVDEHGNGMRVDSLDTPLKDGFQLKHYPSATFFTEDGQRISGVGIAADGKTLLDSSGRELTVRETDTVSVTRDTDKIVESVKTFIDEYNKLVKTINDYLNEDATYREYAPLTDEQRKEMSEKQIEMWEEKAKEGLLRRDTILDGFLRSMRSIWYETNSSGYAIYQLGIETGEWSTRGQLTLSADGEATLRQMLASDPTGVMNFFSNSVDGAAVRVNDVIREVANTSSGSPGTLVQLAGIKGKASETDNTLYKEIKSIDERIERLKNQYEQEKDRYWDQFNAMEQMIANMNSQSAWLMQQFSY